MSHTTKSPHKINFKLKEHSVKTKRHGTWTKNPYPRCSGIGLEYIEVNWTYTNSWNLTGCTMSAERAGPGHYEIILRYLWKSWWSREIPDAWKTANVIPVFKKDEKEDLGNYILVSLTSIPGKIVEQTIPRTTSKHVEHKKGIGDRKSVV